jgi:dTDP-glucose 4,6-dehydratase
MSAWLITGGAGFIGSNFARALCASPPGEIVIFDALSYAGNLATIRDLIDAGKVRFEHGDVRQLDAVRRVFARYDIERVVHCAAESHVDRSILGPRTFFDTNVSGTVNLLIAARERWQLSAGRRRVFLHVSTDEVYGELGPEDPPFNEQTTYAPSSPYAASKAAADHAVHAWHHTYGLPTIITHCSNNYGPWQFPEKLIPLSILNSIEGKELPVYGDGLQVRDWLHVDDHCDALLQVLERGTVGETYCIGGGNQRPNIALVETICDLVDGRLKRPAGTARRSIRHVADRPGHDRRYAIDNRKIGHELGWRPRRDLAGALPEVVDWYLDHGDWHEAIRSGEYRHFYAEQYRERLRTTS